MGQANKDEAARLGLPGRMAYALVSFALRGKAALPRRLPAKPKRVSAALSGSSMAARRARIRFEPIETTKSSDCHSDVEDLVRDLVADRDWGMLAELLEEWDQARAACPMNRRLIYTAMDCITETLREDQDHGDLSQMPDAELDTLVDQAARTPKLYALGAILAQISIAQAWDAQGQTKSLNFSKVRRLASRGHVVCAIEAIAHLDPTQLKSPLLASVHFALLPFLSDPKSKLSRYYEARVHLDPEDIAPHYSMGRMMLPQWFGSNDQLEILGRQAVAWTHRRTGAAAYCALYNGALARDGAPLFLLDPELFEEGTEDLIRYRKRDPSHVPKVVETLWGHANMDYPEGLDPQERATWDGKCKRMGELSLDMVRMHLTAIHPESWQNGLDGAMTFVERAMHAELEAGATVHINRSGLKVV